MPQNRERWTITVELPAGIMNGHGGRFMARILKHLARAWGVRCRAVGVDNEVRRLQALVDGLARRVAAQTELLTRAAQRTEECYNHTRIPATHVSRTSAAGRLPS